MVSSKQVEVEVGLVMKGGDNVDDRGQEWRWNSGRTEDIINVDRQPKGGNIYKCIE